jgi:hypothetical protein
MNKEYWIIDTDEMCENSNIREAVGPYPTKKAAESAALNNIRDVWNDSCTCLKTAEDTDWCAPLLIVEVLRKVTPKITAKIELVDA